MKLFQFIPFILLFTLSILSFRGMLRFGTGLGDIAFHIGIHLSLCIYTIFLLFRTELKLRPITNIIFPILALIFSCYIILSMTIWRSVESSWNGQIFF